MFTGLVEDLGTVAGITPQGRGVRLTIRTGLPLTEVAIGDSIAVNGACLTVETVEGDAFTVVAGRETLDLTTTGALRAGHRVHLERALRVGDRLGGHLVQGHVDGVGRIVRADAAAESRVVWVELPEDLARYVAAKGSICLDGVSMTVNEVRGRELRVNVVPHTQAVTRLGVVAAGDPINIEVDVLAKYVERLLGVAPDRGLSLQTLVDNGYTDGSG